MECPNCAGENRDTAHFCNRCGQRLDSTSAIMANSSSHEYVSLPEQLVSGIVQILDADENISGTGFVVSQAGLIATCSHVIQTKKLQLENKRHLEKVTIVFLATGDKQDARIKSDWWQPPNLGDLAILQIEGILPKGVRPLPLGSAEGTSGHEICTFGFPFTGDIEGIGGDGKVVRVLTGAGKSIIQLRSSEITVGFSGAPIWDKLRRRVIGMVSDITEPDPHHRLVETAFAITTETLRIICPVLQISDVCPYRGLAAFGVDDAEFFFGRQQVVDSLVNRLRHDPRFLTVLGPSGSGKSSLVQAGFIPQLRSGKAPGSDRWWITVTRPGDNPFDELAKQGVSDGTHDLTGKVRAWLSQHPEHERLVLVFDQFEELFITCPEGLRQDFVAQLTHLLHASLPISVVIVMRDDFYSHMAHHEALVAWLEHSQGPIHVPQVLKRDELTAIVQKPAEAVGLRCEEGLVEAIVRDTIEAAVEAEDGGQAGRSAVLPLLEFALTELWKRRQEGMLSHEAYRRIGAVAGALTQWADRAFFALKSEEQQQLAHRIFTDLVYLGDADQGILDSRRRRTLISLCQDDSEQHRVQKVVQQLVEHRLLVTDRDLQSNNEVVEIIHDALLRTWRRLKQWIDEDRDFLLWHQKLQEKVREWVETDAYHPAKRDSYKLLGGRDLAVAREWQAKRKADLSLLEQGFFKASEQQQHKIALRRRILFTVFSVLLVIAIVLASVAKANFQSAQVQGQRADTQARIAHSHALATFANSSLVQNQQDRALLLSLMSLHLNNDQVTTDSLLTALEYSPHIETILQEPGGIGNGATQGITGLIFSPDGHTLFSADGDDLGNVRLWNMTTKKPYGSILLLPLEDGNTIRGMSLSPDGRTLLVESRDSNWLWDAKTDTRLTQLPKNYAFIAFRPDGKLIVSECLDRIQPSDRCDQEQILLVDAFSGNLLKKLLTTPRKQLLGGATLSSDGKSLALNSCPKFMITSTDILCSQRQIQLWDLELGTTFDLPIATLAGNTNSGIFSPDGKLLALGEDTIVRLWNVSSDSQFGSPLTGHTGKVSSIAFSPNGKLLATGGDTTVRLWNVSATPFSSINGDTGTLFRPPFIGHRAQVTSIAFSPDGRYVVSGSRDNNIILWNPGADSAISRRLVSSDGQAPNPYINVDPINDILSPDGKLVAECVHVTDGTAYPKIKESSMVHIWDRQTGKLLHTLFPNSNCPTLSFSPDGKLLSAVRVWNVATGEFINTSPFNKVENIVFNPNGRTFATFAEGSNVVFSPSGRYMVINSATTLWDIAQGRIIHQFPSPPPLMSVLWDMQTNTSLGELPAYSISAAFSPDSRTLASIEGSTSHLKLLDVKTMKSIDDLGDAGGEYVAFSPDGKLLTTGGGLKNKTFRLWDMTNPTPTPIAHPIENPDEKGQNADALDSIVSLNFSSDGVLMVGQGTGITFWNVTLASWISRACSIAHRNFTEFEWRKFAPGESYPLLCNDQSFDASIIGKLLLQAHFANLGGNQEQLQTFYKEATKWATLSDNPLLNDIVCWEGGLTRLVANVILPACERAVALDSRNGNYHDSRGVVRAEIGDIQGAIVDLKFFVNWTKVHNLYTDRAYGDLAWPTERKQWIKLLESGQTKQMLNALMGEKNYDTVGITYALNLVTPT